MIRVAGRLEFADIPYESKHQIIIPKKDRLVEKLILHLHTEASHPGPETTFGNSSSTFLDHWRATGDQEDSYQMSCVPALENQTEPTENGPLAEHVQVTSPFTNVGLAFMGPLYLKSKENENPSKAYKAYVCIFVCEDTRADHKSRPHDHGSIPTSISSNGKSTRYAKHSSFR